MVPISLLGSVSPTFARVPDDPFYDRQWYLKQVNAEAAWDVTTGSPTAVVAVVDTAMDIDHEDLKENIWTNAKEIFGNSIDDDGNGYVDDIYGWNFLNESFDVRPPAIPDPNGTDRGRVHATLVASLIAGHGGNGKGIAGVAWHARIMPLVALDSTGDGGTDDVAEAIRYAVDNGAHVINMSLEGYQSASDVDQAIKYAQSKGVLTVAAAGNANIEEGFDLDDTNVFPVCVSNDASYGLIGVGSTDRLDRHALFSNYGSCIQVSAPGDDIFGARPAFLANGSAYADGYSGTSLAAPLVAGTAALIKSLRPDWGWAEIRERIMASATPVDHLQSPIVRGRIGRGRLDIAAAVRDIPRASVAETPVVEQRSWEVSGTITGRPTRARIRSASSTVEIIPFGSGDTRGARAALNDVDGDGTLEVIIVPASGRVAEWVIAGTDGKERRRGVVARDLRSGLLVASAPGGAVLADPNGGRAWGVDASGVSTLFRPYGSAYRAGLDMVSVPGGVAFAPRGGGGHLMVTDRAGKRLASVFPFGKTARGRWSITKTGTSLVMNGPLGSMQVSLAQVGADGWQDVPAPSLNSASLISSSGRRSDITNEIVYDAWQSP